MVVEEQTRYVTSKMQRQREPTRIQKSEEHRPTTQHRNAGGTASGNRSTVTQTSRLNSSSDLVSFVQDDEMIQAGRERRTLEDELELSWHRGLRDAARRNADRRNSKN